MIFPSLLKSFHALKAFIYHYMAHIRILAIVIAVVLVGFFSYRWYQVRRDAAAQYAFAYAMEEFMQMRDAKTGSWDAVEQVFKTGYEQHGSSNIAPYFLAFQAQALVYQDKKQEALELFDKIHTLIPASSPLSNLYKVQRMLLMIDSKDQGQHDAGLQELIDLAHDTKNKFRDEALYYLGLYYAGLGDNEHARAEWNLLTQAFTAQGQTGSVYAELAQARLEQIA